MLALGWSALLRVPIIVNAPAHLDSDLAVDGLTLRDAVEGQWRWHYPGTPYMGSAAVLLSYLPAKLWGTTPATLVAGGTIAYLSFLAGVFATSWACFGPKVAAWCLIPLAFASTGTIWLTGRITGGHLLAAAWSAWAWFLFARLASGRVRPWTVCLFGVWCGLGLWHDSMFLMTLVGLMPACLIAVARRRADWSATAVLSCGLAVAAGFAIGAAPRTIGRIVEPHDAYNEQFAWSLEPASLTEHARILALDCLPRLVAGHRLPGLEADPDPTLLGGGAPVQRAGQRRDGVELTAVAATALGLMLFAGSITGLAVRGGTIPGPGKAVAIGLLVSSTAILAAFVVNRNIFNSDNYRYLVLLLIPGSLGFGLVLDALARRSPGGLATALALALGFGLAFTLDAASWYRRLGFLDDRWAVVTRPVDDPALRWLNEHDEVVDFTAGYWDAYRLAFLSGRPLRGIPHPIYPNRFPEWSADLPGGRSTTLIARPGPEDQRCLQQAIAEGGAILARERGTTIATWPIPPR